MLHSSYTNIPQQELVISPVHLRALQVNFCDNHPRKTASAQIEDFQKPCKKKDVHDVDFLKCIGNVTINLFNQEHLSVIPYEMKTFFGNLGLTLHFVQLADTRRGRGSIRRRPSISTSATVRHYSPRPRARLHSPPRGRQTGRGPGITRLTSA